MKASAELEGKLKRRLTLQNEVANPISASPQRIAPAALVEEQKVLQLREKLRHACHSTQKREEVLEQRRRDVAPAANSDLRSEIRRLRADVEELRKDLIEVKVDVQRCLCAQERHLLIAQEQEVQADLKLAVAEAKAEQLAAEVTGREADCGVLQEQMAQLGEAVANQLSGHKRLEALLRKSEVMEVEMRKRLEAVERPRLDSAVAEFTLHADDGESCVGSDDAALEDLEHSYEGLELSSVASLQQHWDQSDTDATDGYEAPLRALELVLTRKSGVDKVPSPGSSPAAGTGEAVDAFDEHIACLQDVLSRLNAAQVHADDPAETASCDTSPLGPQDESSGCACFAEAEPEIPAPTKGSTLLGFGLFSPYAMLGQKYQTAEGECSSRRR